MIINNSVATVSNAHTPPAGNGAVVPKAAESRASAERLSSTFQRVDSGRTADWRNLRSQTARTMSDDEIKDRVREQASIDFANGAFQNDEFWALHSKFVAIVSPDRVGYMQNATKDLTGSSNQVRGLKFWEMLLKVERGEKIPLDVSGIDVSPSGEILNFTVHDSDGNPIIHFHRDSGGWTELFTPAERERSKAIMQVYHETWTALYRQAQRENNRFEMIPRDLGVGTVDFRG